MWLNRLVLLMISVVAVAVGFDLIAAGKQYIQYAWFFAALASLIALLVQLKKDKVAVQHT